MLTPSVGTLADYNTAILAGSQTHARLVFPVQNVTLTDNDISISGGVARTSIMNPEEDLVFGRAVMDELQIRLLNGSVFNGFDWTEEFHIDFGVEMNGTTNWVTTGYFKGKKPKRTIRTDTIDFIAYDRMQAFDILADEFLANEVFPITMEDLFHDLCTYCGVNYAVGDEMADSMALTYAEDTFADGITCRMILAWIAEANCCTAKINAAGEVKLTWYTNQTSNYSINENKYYDIDIDENTVPAMDSVRISSTDAEIAGFMYPVIGTNPYEIIDNPLLMFLSTADKTTVITNIVARFTAFGTYVPVSVNPIANWMVETGDIIEVQYDNGSTMSMPVFNKTFEWAGMGVDYYECVGNAERQTAAESAKDEYVLGGKLSDKYTIRSGIDINDNGIDVTGNKYVKIRSGGVFDVESTNMDVDSDDGYIALKNIMQGYLPCNLFLGNHNFEQDHRNLIISPRPDTGGIIEWVDSQTGVLPFENHASLYFQEWMTLIEGTGMFFRGIIGNSYQISGGQKDNEHQYGDAMFSNLVLEKLYGDCVKNDLLANSVGYVLDARQGKVLDDIKAGNLILTSSDDTWAKIWAKVNELPVAKPYTFYGNATAVNILSKGVRNNTLIGIIMRNDTDKFALLVRMGASANGFATVYWTGVSSSDRGTYSELDITGEINNIAKRAFSKTDISPNSSESIPLENNGRYLIITDCAASTLRDLMIVGVANSGSVGVSRVLNASNLAIDTSISNILKLTNNNGTHTLDVFVEKLQ